MMMIDHHTQEPQTRGLKNQRLKIGIAVLVVGALAGCGGTDIEYNYPRTGPGGVPTYEKHESLFGEGGLTLWDNQGTAAQTSGEGGGIGVNSFLWRASLDTVSFLPLRSADPFGGVIITDWYAPPDAAQERFKVNIFILDRALRSDGVRARVFKQQRRSDGGWDDARADDQLDRQLEDAILTRARELRIQILPQAK
jgi:hypothetical protein